ncbi:MAG: hypothetical protein M1818_005008 [Claussenomyces sp. TS43310]|nr:MAG: hypothetical protein M1818_005008 [Claussenomyces sp. TS43310]
MSETQTQQPRQTETPSFERGQSVQRRLDDLEGMVRTICEAVHLNIDSSSLADFEISATEALKRLRPAPAPEAASEHSSIRRTDAPGILQSKIVHTAPTAIDQFKDAPLLKLFRDAMLIQGTDGQVDEHRRDLSADHRMRTCIGTLKAIMPSLDDLALILKTTRKYWPIWQAFPSDCLDPGGNASAMTFILDSMKSDSLAIVARSVLCLALCVQQLPCDFQYQQASQAASSTALLESYLNGAETLLSSEQGSAGTMIGLECLMIQIKLYLNMGRPRRAWLTSRRAVSLALLLGLHRLKDGAEQHQTALWSRIWQGDRHLSLVVGLPSAIDGSHPGLSNQHAGHSDEAQFAHNLGIITGHIIERNQNHQSVSYSVTLRIDRELQRLRSEIPFGSWDTTPSPDMSLEAVYGLQVSKIFYYHLRKMLHLPYMLKSSVDGEYEGSRVAALESSREIIKCYQVLRGHGGSAFIVCDLMDFQAFTAALVIIIDLLSQVSQYNSHEEPRDWELVHSVISHSKMISSRMECNVASQAAQLLEYLSMASRGSYFGPETYEAVIPYFGKVRISRPAASRTDSASSGTAQIQTPRSFSNNVELSTNSFVSFNENVPGESLFEAELGIDWTSVSDIDANYDWTQLFDSTEFG